MATLTDSGSQPNILIFGFGAVGATYGMILHRAGCRITAVCRSNHAHVAAQGVLIRSPLWGHQRYHPRAVQTVAEAAISPTGEPEVYDYILVGSKAFPGTAELIHPAVTPSQTTIVLAQNGIGIEQAYADLYPSNPLISGVVYLPVTQVLPGEIEHAGDLQRFEIGLFPTPTPSAPASPQATQRLQHLSTLWSAGAASAPIFADVQPTKWRKLAINAAWNPITALTLCDDANYLRSSTHSPTSAISPAESEIRALMHETALIAAAAGHPSAITPSFIESDLARPRARLRTGGKEPSMLVDVQRGRRMEVEAILGNAVRIGAAHGVDMPKLTLLYALARAREFALLKPAGEGGWGEIARH